MPVFDMDSHLREEYFLDEVYRLDGKFAHLRPVRLNNEASVRARFKHELSPWPREVAEHFNHSIVYDVSANWNGGEIARRQVAIACNGSLFWRVSEMFDESALGAAAGGYVVVRDTTCRLFGYHGLTAAGGRFSLDHMFGF